MYILIVITHNRTLCDDDNTDKRCTFKGYGRCVRIEAMPPHFS